MLLSIAINETDKAEALILIDLGYMQSTKSVLCPLCGKKYLLLLDQIAYQRASGTGKTIQTTALSYFSEKLQETHHAGHLEHRFIMI